VLSKEYNDYYGGIMSVKDINGIQNIGYVSSVRGSVVDVRFPKQLPKIHNQLQAGRDGRQIFEVLTHLDREVVRCIALTPTQGLARGSIVTDTSKPLMVPVGEGLLGRVFNVFGNPIDHKGIVKAAEWRSIHQPPVPPLKADHNFANIRNRNKSH